MFIERMLKARGYSRTFRAPEPGDDGGGSEDRGDNWTPTETTAREDADRLGVDEPGGGEEDRGDLDTKPEVKPPVKKEVKAPAVEKKDDDKGDEKDEKDEKADDKKDDKAPRKDTRIPVARHQEILAKERAARKELEDKLAQYENGQRVAATNADIGKAETQVIALEEEYNALIADGKTKEATAKMREIRTLERDISEKKTTMATEAATARAVETVRYDTAVERLEAAYPEINPEHDDFDQELMTDVVALSQTYTRSGLTPTAAIQKAVKRLCKPATAAQKDAVDVTPRVDKSDVKSEVEKERKAAAARKAGEVSDKQPPSIARVGADSDRAGGNISAKDVLKMSQQDFNKLDDETLARMRGDIL